MWWRWWPWWRWWWWRCCRINCVTAFSCEIAIVNFVTLHDSKTHNETIPHTHNGCFVNSSFSLLLPSQSHLISSHSLRLWVDFQQNRSAFRPCTCFIEAFVWINLLRLNLLSINTTICTGLIVTIIIVVTAAVIIIVRCGHHSQAVVGKIQLICKYDAFQSMLTHKNASHRKDTDDINANMMGWMTSAAASPASASSLPSDEFYFKINL